MPLFNEENQVRLKGILSQLDKPVNIVYFTQEFECAACKDTRTFLEEIVSFSDKLKLTVCDFTKDSEKVVEYWISKIPAIAILDENNIDTRIRFYGVPAGYEINSFLLSLLEVSGKLEPIPEPVKSRVDAINKSVHIQVFVTLSCPYCPAAVSSAHRLALENKNIVADMVESSSFPHLTMAYNVTGVPRIIINETHVLVGAQPMERFLDEIEKI